MSWLSAFRAMMHAHRTSRSGGWTSAVLWVQRQFSIGPPVILRVSTKNYLITTSSHPLTNSLFTNNLIIIRCTWLLKMIVRVLTTCHTQYTWDRSICVFSFNRTTPQVFVTYFTGAVYVHPLWFYKHQYDNRVRSTQNAFSLPFAAILVNCAPSGEMHNYCTLHIIKLWEFLDPSVQLHTPVSSVLCMTSS